jgi:hypothetical protein
MKKKASPEKNQNWLSIYMAARAGLEPATKRLTAARSTTELPGNGALNNISKWHRHGKVFCVKPVEKVVKWSRSCIVEIANAPRMLRTNRPFG